MSLLQEDLSNTFGGSGVKLLNSKNILIADTELKVCLLVCTLITNHRQKKALYFERKSTSVFQGSCKKKNLVPFGDRLE